MRILLDECMPRGLKKHFRDRGQVLTVTDVGLSGYKNGQLLRRITGDFNVFIIDIEPVLPRLFARWSQLKAGTLLIIESHDRR